MVEGFSPGTQVDRYLVEGVLASGGSGTVLRVRHVHLDSAHALKVLHVASETQRERLLREGRIQAALRHPHIVAVTDVVHLPQGVALVMEYVRGPNLFVWALRHRPSIAEVDALAEQLFDAMSCAHTASIIHRDLKPENVLLERHEDRLVARITDFGLAFATDGMEMRLTRSGQCMGTPRYMAPEQYVDARGADVRADVYGLGAILYELLAGKPLFEAESLVEAYTAAAAGRYTPLAELAPDIPVRMVVAVEAALQPKAEDRPATVEAMRQLWRGEGARAADTWSEDALGAAEPMAELPFPAIVPSTVAFSVLEPPPSTPSARARGERIALGVVLLAGLALAITMYVTRFKPPTPPGAAPAIEATTAEASPPSTATAADATPEKASADSVVNAALPTAAGNATDTHAPSASVRVTGVQRARLLDDAGHELPASGPVAPGAYTLEVWFDKGEPTRVLELDLTPGLVRVVRCTAALRVCH